MSLFIGNLSRDVHSDELQDAFSHYGSCKVSHRGPYGFVEYDKESDAEVAKTELTGKKFSGFAINIEWSKKSGHYEPRGRPSRGRRGPPRRRRSYDRSRSHSRSRSPHYRRDRRHHSRRDHRRRSPSVSSRSRSRSKSSRSSRSDYRDKKRRRSPLPEQQRARSKSQSSDKQRRDEPSPNN